MDILGLPARGLVFNATPQSFKYLFRLTSAGQTRPLSKGTRDFLVELDSHVENSLSASLFSHEVLVREGTTEIWMPIQTSLLRHWTAEVTAGTSVDVRAVMVGWIDSNQIYVINAFTSLGPSDD